MPVLDDAELDQIRADLASTRNLSCQIQRPPTTTPDGYGTSSGSYTTIVTVMAGTGNPSANMLATYASRIGSLVVEQVRLPFDVDVKEQDHLVMGGHTLVVQVLLEPSSFDFETFVLASEVQSG